MKLHPYFEPVRWPQRPEIRLDGSSERAVKLQYDKSVDALYIKLSDAPSTESSEVAPDVVLDFDQEGRLVGIDVDHASKHVDITALESMGLPLQSATGRAAATNPQQR